MPEYTLDTSLDRDVWKRLDPFTQGYIEAAMWTLTDEDGEPCDHLGLHDIARETIIAAIAECADFQHANRELLDRATEETGRPDSHHGHDFWLTRNGHGAGFWDRGYSRELGAALTTAAKVYGGCNWYLGDDGLVYGD